VLHRFIKDSKHDHSNFYLDYYRACEVVLEWEYSDTHWQGKPEKFNIYRRLSFHKEYSEKEERRREDYYYKKALKKEAALEKAKKTKTKPPYKNDKIDYDPPLEIIRTPFELVGAVSEECCLYPDIGTKPFEWHHRYIQTGGREAFPKMGHNIWYEYEIVAVIDKKEQRDDVLFFSVSAHQVRSSRYENQKGLVLCKYGIPI